MGALQEILNAQRKWAQRHERLCHPTHDYYVARVEANLREPLSPHAYEGFNNGAGGELRDTIRRPAGMKALRSSAALVANVFDYWTDKPDQSFLLRALGLDSDSAMALDFEKKFPTEVDPRHPPHLDFAITLDSGHLIAIESKFTEWTGRTTKEKTHFSDKYFRSTIRLWRDFGLKECQALVHELHENQGQKPPLFEHLDAAQLLKHALGLATSPGKGEFSLWYLYYDWPGEESAAHKDEIKSFCARVGEELNFKALTYQEVYERLRLSEAIEPEYLTYLRDRYFCGKGAPRD